MALYKAQKMTYVAVRRLAIVILASMPAWLWLAGCNKQEATVEPVKEARPQLADMVDAPLQDVKESGIDQPRRSTGDSGVVHYPTTAAITPAIAPMVESESKQAEESPPRQFNDSGSNEGGNSGSVGNDESLRMVSKTLTQSKPILNTLSDPTQADTQINVTFNEVDIRVVLDTIGDITGINFIVDNSVQGPVTVFSPTPIRLGNLYSFLESTLAVQGYAAIPAGEFVKIVPRADAAKHHLTVRFGSDPDDIALDDSFITQIIPLRYADTAEVVAIIKPMLSPGANIATYPRTNEILISGTSANIHHIAVIVQQLDVHGAKEEWATITLKYASAQRLSKQITEIMAKQRVAGKQGYRPNVSDPLTRGFKILPNIRTNSLLVLAKAHDMATIRDIVMQLDIERPQGATIANVKFLKYAKAEEIEESLSPVLAKLQQSADNETLQHVQISCVPGTNSLIVISSAQDYKVIESIIDQLDIFSEQVHVEMLIVEISEDILQEIGIDWQTLDQAVADNLRAFGQTNYGLKLNYAAGNLEGLSVGAWKNVGGDLTLGAILHALHKESGINILSRPHLTTSNHHSATIDVVDNIPYISESRITETDPENPTIIKKYDYKDVGVILTITPHVSQGGFVTLDIESEFSKLIEGVTGLGDDTPTTAMRRAKTGITMQSESTVVIGGLLRDDKVTIEKKVPLLGDIPLLGELFKWKRHRLQKTNLLVFITPTIITDSQGLRDITEKRKAEMQLPEDYDSISAIDMGKKSF